MQIITSLSLPIKVHAALKAEAIKEHRSVSNLASIMIQEAIKKKENKSN